MAENSDSRSDPNLISTSLTSVDLGDDLLEKTAILPGESVRPDLPPPVPALKPLQNLSRLSIEEQFENAEIMIREGFHDEAKKLLRGMLIRDPRLLRARKLLEEVLDLELKRLMGGSVETRRSTEPVALPHGSNVDPDEIMRKLDEDLGLGMEETESPSSPDVSQVEVALAGATVQDRMDMGIAFIEMGLFDLAVKQFKHANDELSLDPEAPAEKKVSATALLAYSLIEQGDPLEATLVLQPRLSESEIEPRQKLELFYLMARASESLGKSAAAAQWYMTVHGIDPDYRDVRERLSRR